MKKKSNLNLSELIKNYILSNMESDIELDIYKNLWDFKVKSLLFNKASEFFRDYLQLKTAKSIKIVSDDDIKNIYQLFKNFIANRFTNYKEFINDVVDYVKYYKWIIDDRITDKILNDLNKNLEIVELIKNIFHDIKAEAFKPLVLGLLYYHQSDVNGLKFSDDLLISILKTIHTYLIRRRILGLKQGENRDIISLCTQVENLGDSNVKIIDLLSSLSYCTRFPNDNEIREKFVLIDFDDNLKKYPKFILEKIDEYAKTHSIKIDRLNIVNYFLEIFSLPDSYKNSSNWRSKIEQDRDYWYLFTR
ncbi:hypothetical protein JXR93_00870 [bacterium]|nr:hypothetical protein [bacterium]